MTTTLLHKKVGAEVNLECDVIGKYVEKLLGLTSNKKKGQKEDYGEKFLRQNGFM